MEKQTRGIQLLRGDPKKAILRLAFPMMAAMLIQALYNLVDGIWVAGLGPQALAAIGLFFPILMIILSFAGGVSVGVSSAISRKIGEKNKEEADSAAIHSVILALSFGIVATVVVLPLIDSILKLTGATNETLKLSVDYSNILLLAVTLLMFNNVANGILRGEGDTKKSMYAITFGAVLNIFLDPLFIYVLKFGVKGAAYATVISIAASTILMSYWLFIAKNT
ncbi:MAG: hypothetical protein PWQ48_599, partial [Thermotogaceae bacterium]|nr:hypothetical protein [Thermotogaceae bacterium]